MTMTIRETGTGTGTTGVQPGSRPAGARGRHRRPRSRRPLYAVGGLALIAGVLGLVRVAPEPGAGTPGTAEAEPRPDPGVVPERSAPRVPVSAAVVPTALPTATSAMGGVSVVPASSTARPLPAEVSTPLPTTVPHARAGTGTRSAPASAPSAPARASSAPRPDPPAAPAPEPSRTRSAPQPEPSRPEGLPDDICVPVIGLCVDPLRDPHGLLPPRHRADEGQDGARTRRPGA